MIAAASHPSGPGSVNAVVLEPDPVLARLLPRFLANRERDVATIIETLECGDFARLEGIGHNLKGTGRCYGCDGISEIGEALETAARNGDAEAIRKQASELRGYLGRVVVTTSCQDSSSVIG